MLFAAILGNTFSCTKKNLFDSYAAIFAAKCHSCNIVAKVQIISESRKFFRNYFCFQGQLICDEVSQFPTFPLLTSVFPDFYK